MDKRGTYCTECVEGLVAERRVNKEEHGNAEHNGSQANDEVEVGATQPKQSAQSMRKIKCALCSELDLL